MERKCHFRNSFTKGNNKPHLLDQNTNKTEIRRDMHDIQSEAKTIASSQTEASPTKEAIMRTQSGRIIKPTNSYIE